MEIKRSFKGVWIPKEIWLNKNLTLHEKLFFVEINSLDNDHGCFASNSHFSEFFGVSKGRCTQIIKSLEAKNMISITIERDGKMISKRVIKILNTLFNKLNTPIKKIKHPYLENDEDNNTSINNTETNIKNINNENLNLFPLKDLSKTKKNKEAHEAEILEAEILEFSFDEFWEIYPNKVNKKKAKEKFNKLSKSDKDKIEQHLPMFISNPPFKDYSYPHAITYLNQERFNDEVQINNTNLKLYQDERINELTTELRKIIPDA